MELRINATDLRVQLVHHGGADLAGRLLPESNHVLVALFFSDETLRVLAINLGDILVRLSNDRLLPLRHRNVKDRDGHTATGRRLKADALDAVGEECGLALAEEFKGAADQLAQVGARHLLVHKAETVWKDLVELDATDGGLNALFNNGVCRFVPDACGDINWGVQLHLSELVGEQGLRLIREAAALFA